MTAKGGREDRCGLPRAQAGFEVGAGSMFAARDDLQSQSAKADFPNFQPPVSTGGRGARIRAFASAPMPARRKDLRVGVREADFGQLLQRIYPPPAPLLPSTLGT
jgi:hypothetical protein